MAKKQIKKTLRGSTIGQRKVVRRKSVKAARPAQKGGLKVVEKLVSHPNFKPNDPNWAKSIRRLHRGQAEGRDFIIRPSEGKLLYGVRHQDAVDRIVLEHREREKRADQQELRVLLGVV